jgi:hypothetical protein
MFNIQSTVKLYHWQTSLYSRHGISDSLLTELQALFDKFVEVYIGKHGKPIVPQGIRLVIKEIRDDEFNNILSDYITFFKEDVLKSINADTDRELLTVCDDIVNLLNKTRFLANMK